MLHIRDTLEQNKGMDNQYVHHLLSADNVELFTRIYTSDTLTQWCETHVREALALPNVRNAWVAEIDSFVTHITRAYNHVPDSVKAHILNSRSKPAASYFPDDVAEHLACNIGLQGDDRWSTIPTEWVGAPGSELRHAAEALGWSPDVLVLQLDEASRQQTSISPILSIPTVFWPSETNGSRESAQEPSVPKRFSPATWRLPWLSSVRFMEKSVPMRPRNSSRSPNASPGTNVRRWLI